jgi:hypothetical protein
MEPDQQSSLLDGSQSLILDLPLIAARHRRARRGAVACGSFLPQAYCIAPRTLHLGGALSACRTDLDSGAGRHLYTVRGPTDTEVRGGIAKWPPA